MDSRRQEQKGDSLSEELTVDWRGRPSTYDKHGGMRAAAFVLGVQTFEIMAIAAVGNNLITYVTSEMHFSLSKAANIVTNFIGTVFILSLFGGHLSDSYLGCFWTMLIFGFIELSGFILLSVQAHLPQLKPPQCNMLTDGDRCIEAKGVESLIFFVALYMVALGSGCVKPNMLAHGADQFSRSDSKQSKKLSTYFNAAYFAFSVGELIALTLIVWIQTHSGMDIGFGVSAIVMAMGLICLVSGTIYYRNKPPRGSVLVPIAQVLVAAFLNRRQASQSNPQMLHGNQNEHWNRIIMTNETSSLGHTDRFRFLDNACIRRQEGNNNNAKESPWRICTINQVEQVKILISVIPIFACTIVFNTILAQLQTFSVSQGSVMNNEITKSFHIPPASLQAIPYILLIFVVPLYDYFFVPFARKITGHDSGITPLQRIGVGLFVATFSMVSAALMEKKRRDSFLINDQTLSIFWIAPQFLIFGVSEMFTAVGLIEFFYKQNLKGMQSLLTAMTYCSYSFGFYLSSVYVSLINKITSRSKDGGWLGDNDLNKDRLDLFYWVLAGVSLINFFNYLFWARWYNNSRKSSSSCKLHRHSIEEGFPNTFNTAKVVEDGDVP
ncbi:putative proton-dependent oligopeptide transporter family, MFS transporter superfamily [Helianthus annuus]|uniref:Proton-dependent oligopeptide transporter family, major facilitator superfamily n=1 Tax=Helianthus annuus TaxID=4232 RepID=A0A251TA34_HELAN|nr:protein NRT1/ PTR FAMILY 4.3 [Helianthus annuus]KAF5781859.1 putative proton-dependent oligopeptide transporter family, major facilitator superfamily [Helianthus annuus]KAJ0501407.1 putative proton-dependent oligopeptide transporter family, MFS transporter superfamily [Helianthus annuus]KAJ0509204.1 putative proton-dependent oligopeptide transporter family, MFS transporter superfamily [Helianthus annuus]KAJ0517315.1 putative proton-dependent oligopeptide transporter family, MFS transporter s